jgi:uncharacterized protein YbaP (TraB family)
MVFRTLTGLVLCVSMSVGAQAAPALWKVSDADSSIYLFGSVHMLRPDQEWRTPLIDKVVSKAERVYFETDISPAGQAEAASLSIMHGFNTDGRLLSAMISPELMAQLRAAAQSYSVPMASLLAMKPWMAATTISAMPLLESGYVATYGVETVLSAELAHERIGMLETVEEQMVLLSGGTEAEGIEMLQASLDTLDTVSTDIEALTTNWANGDPEALGELFMEQMGPFDSIIVERLIDDRNKNWTEQIAAMLERDEKALLVVGAAHLAGEMSVVKLLEDKGFTSERMQ